jgi:hypothetical protein
MNAPRRRIGAPARTLVASVLLIAALAAPARAADSLNVFADNNKIGLGTATRMLTHATVDGSYGGGHITYKYKPGIGPCGADPQSDGGRDVTGGQVPVPAGAGDLSFPGGTIQLGLGQWIVCGWLVDDSTGAVAAVGSTDIRVLPYVGSIALGMTPAKSKMKFSLIYTSSANARLYLTVQRASVACPRRPSAALQVFGKRGHTITTTGFGMSGIVKKSLSLGRLHPGNWRACSWLVASGGSFGPVTRTFSVFVKK